MYTTVFGIPNKAFIKQTDVHIRERHQMVSAKVVQAKTVFKKQVQKIEIDDDK